MSHNPELLTDLERKIVKDLGLIWNDLCAMTGRRASRGNDLAEAASHVHALQHYVMAQAAARAYPTEFRLAGGDHVS